MELIKYNDGVNKVNRKLIRGRLVGSHILIIYFYVGILIFLFIHKIIIFMCPKGTINLRRSLKFMDK